MRHSCAIALAVLLAISSRAEDVPVAPREMGPHAESTGDPFVVADGDDFVVVWPQSGQSRFGRIRHADVVLQAGDFGRPGQVLSAVAGPSGSVLAAFSDADGIHVARISRGGDVQMSERIADSFSSMAWNGSVGTLLLVMRSGDTIRTDGDGRVLGHGAHLDLTEEGWSSTAARGNGFVIAWAAQNPILVTTLDAAGAVSHTQVIADRRIGRVAIGCAPSGSCLLLSAMGEPLSGQILGESTGPVFRISEDPVADAIPPVWDGQRFLVVWTDYSFGDTSMHAKTRVDGVTLDGTVIPIATFTSPDRNHEGAAIARSNDETVVVWRDTTRCNFAGAQIMARSLSNANELRLTSGLSAQDEPTIAAGASTSLIAWVERGGGSRIRARMFPFTSPTFDVSAGPSSSTPVIGTDGSGYLVAWRESDPEDDCRRVLRVSLIGSETTFSVGQDVDSAIQITWNGSEYVVLWEQDDPAQLFAIRVSRAGQPLDFAPVPLTTAEKEPDGYTSIDHEPAGLFWTGDGYLLLWRRSRTAYIPWYPDPPPQFDIRVTRIGRELTPAATPQTVAPLYTVVATMKGNNIIALWKSGDSLHAVRLAADGSVIADRDLGIDVTPWRIVATRTGYAVLTYGELLFLDDDLSLVGRRATPAPVINVAGTSEGLVAVYVADGEVFFSPPFQRRRRSMR